MVSPDKIMATKEKVQDNKNNQEQVFLLLLYRYFNILIIIVFVLALLVGGLFIIKPKYGAISASRASASEEKAEQSAALTAYMAKLNQYKKQYGEVSSMDKDKINKMIPDKENAEDIFAKLEGMFKKRGMIINNIKINAGAGGNTAVKTKTAKAPAASAKGLGEINASMSFSAVDYKSFKDILSILENDLRITDVNKVNFSPANNSLTLEITTYYYN